MGVGNSQTVVNTVDRDKRYLFSKIMSKRISNECLKNNTIKISRFDKVGKHSPICKNTKFHQVEFKRTASAFLNILHIKCVNKRLIFTIHL